MIRRTTYGVEYFPHPEDRQPSGIGWLVALVVIATVTSLGYTLYHRIFDGREEEDPGTVTIVTDERPAEPPPDEPVAETPAEPAGPVEPVAAADAAKPSGETEKMPDPPPVPVVERTEATVSAPLVNRPSEVKNLLLRLEEAARRKDVQMEATTIEQLRAQPGAADLDDPLARRLGALNYRRLFELKSKEWVRLVEVRRGDKPQRISIEHGCTYAAMLKLNGGEKKVGAIRPGGKIYVMLRPKFSLTVHRRLGFADLTLNGRFFRRYDFETPLKVANGVYKWSAVSSKLQFRKQAELEMLLPKVTVTTISET